MLCVTSVCCDVTLRAFFSVIAVALKLVFKLRSVQDTVEKIWVDIIVCVFKNTGSILSVVLWLLKASLCVRFT